MTRVSAAFNRDANNVPIVELGLTVSKSKTFASDAIGTSSLFIVTGVVAARVVGVPTVNLTGAGDLAVGIVSNSQAFVAQAAATAIDMGEIWVDATPGQSETLPSFQIINEEDIIQTIAGSTVLTGGITYYCLYSPISDDGLVVAA